MTVAILESSLYFISLIYIFFSDKACQLYFK